MGESDRAQKEIIIARGRRGPCSFPPSGQDGERKMMLFVPLLVQFALLEGLVEL